MKRAAGPQGDGDGALPLPLAAPSVGLCNGRQAPRDPPPAARSSLERSLRGREAAARGAWQSLDRSTLEPLRREPASAWRRCPATAPASKVGASNLTAAMPARCGGVAPAGCINCASRFLEQAARAPWTQSPLATNSGIPTSDLEKVSIARGVFCREGRKSGRRSYLSLYDVPAAFWEPSKIQVHTYIMHMHVFAPLPLFICLSGIIILIPGSSCCSLFSRFREMQGISATLPKKRALT